MLKAMPHRTHATVLFSSAGRRVGLIECFRSSALAAGVDLTVLACDLEPDFSAACRVADRAYSVPRCDTQPYIEAMLDIAKNAGVDLIVPTIDTELPLLAGAIERFAAIGTRVHVSPPAVIDIVRDKVRTAEVMEAAGIPVPWTVPLEAARSEEIAWPAFLKPSGGSASRGIRIVNSALDLPSDPDEPMMLQQLLSGPEYTVNMFIDLEGRLKSAVPHRRLRIRAGEVEKGRTERDPMFRRLAEDVARALPDARGVMCFQLIVDKQAGPRVFEVNARFGGGYPLAHFAGGEYARWLLEEVVGLPSTANDDWRSGALMLRYDAATFAG
jgi:carbamoyl-phosphate synthase large subunit